MLTEKQIEYLREHIEDFYRIFVTEEIGLEKSECSCCQSKREFIHEMKKETE